MPEKKLKESGVPDTAGIPEKAKIEKERRLLFWAVRISACLMCALLLLFFAIAIRNISLIKDQVEYVNDSLYPVSVSMGHIETDLVHMQAFIDSESTHQIVGNNSLMRAEEERLKETLADLELQMKAITEEIREESELVSKMESLTDQLTERFNEFFSDDASKGGDGRRSTDDVTFAKMNLSPLIEDLLRTNNDALDATTHRMDAMYTEVNNSVSVLFTFTIIMSIAVVATGIILLIVIKTMSKFEEHLRKTLTEALKETEQANQAKSTFMANMSHDIRTPMNAIFGLTQIAIENIDDTLRVKQCLTRITTSSQHLLSLINDVLDMNKIESGKVTLSKEVFSLTSLIDEIDVVFKSQPDAKRRRSEVVIDNLYADLLIGDAMRIRQILLNLVSNALKYTNEGDLTRLTVKERSTADPNVANVVFIVEDTGIGMQKDFIDHIFEPFEREYNDFTNFTEGTGLGMAITKNIVDLMGGTIKVESDLGLGTKITISVDLEIAQGDDLEVKDDYLLKPANEISDFRGSKKDAPFGEEDEISDDDAKEDKKPLPKKPNKISVSGRVLIVEDNDINMEIAKELIGSRGAEVDEAYDGHEAVSKVANAEEGTYDLIFMDLQMPHMNGIDATKTIRCYLDEHGRDQIPIVAMTANAFESDKETAIGAGMNDFMAKPINIHQLESMLKKYLS